MNAQPDLFPHERPTQRGAILEYLKQGHSITPLEALQLFGCFRLGARIFELREQGYDIERTMVTVVGKIAGKCTVASYRLKN